MPVGRILEFKKLRENTIHRLTEISLNGLIAFKGIIASKLTLTTLPNKKRTKSMKDSQAFTKMLIKLIISLKMKEINLKRTVSLLKIK